MWITISPILCPLLHVSYRADSVSTLAGRQHQAQDRTHKRQVLLQIQHTAALHRLKKNVNLVNFLKSYNVVE